MSGHVVMFSGGVGSWASASRVVDEDEAQPAFDWGGCGCFVEVPA